MKSWIALHSKESMLIISILLICGKNHWSGTLITREREEKKGGWKENWAEPNTLHAFIKQTNMARLINEEEGKDLSEFC